jgi:stearoyl-CoA desaturase (Delta-9 desaturase)
MTVIIIFFTAHWFLHLFFQSFLHHRYAAHGMFSMKPGWEWFFRILAFIVQGSSSLSLYAYGVMHRLHHMYTGTDKDPHAAEKYKGFKGMLLMTRDMLNNYGDILAEKHPIPQQVVDKVPRLTKFDKVTNNWWIRGAFGAAYLAVYIIFAPHWAWFLLLPIQIALGPIHGIIVNWFNHKVGYINYKLNNDSKNFEIKIGKFVIPWIFGFIMLGENNHNNHHARPRVNFAIKWHEWDPIYPVAMLFAKMGIIKINPAFAAVKVRAKTRKQQIQELVEAEH